MLYGNHLNATVVAAATPADRWPPTAGTIVTLFLLPLLVTMMDVNSMVEMGENEVWLHGDVNSMVAEMELGGVVEGGLKLDASRWWDGRWSEVRTQGTST